MIARNAARIASLALGLTVLCGAAACTNFVEIGRVSPDVTVYTDETVTKNTQYSYRMRAFNSSAGSPYTNVLTVKTLKR